VQFGQAVQCILHRRLTRPHQLLPLTTPLATTWPTSGEFRFCRFVREHAADLATPWFRSSKRSIITKMSSGRRRTKPQTLARIPGSGVEVGTATHQRARSSRSLRLRSLPDSVVGPCTTPRTINRDTAVPPRGRRSQRVLEALRPCSGTYGQCQSRNRHCVSRLAVASRHLRPQSPTLYCQQGLTLGWQQSTPDRPEP
jgi:hypothetical protein